MRFPGRCEDCPVIAEFLEGYEGDLSEVDLDEIPECEECADRVMSGRCSSTSIVPDELDVDPEDKLNDQLMSNEDTSAAIKERWSRPNGFPG